MIELQVSWLAPAAAVLMEIVFAILLSLVMSYMATIVLFSMGRIDDLRTWDVQRPLFCCALIGSAIGALVRWKFIVFT